MWSKKCIISSNVKNLGQIIINWTIPQNILDKTEQLFKMPEIHKGRAILKRSAVTISFKKGSLDGFCIVSGIVRDSKPHEVKLVYKKRFEGSDTGPLSTTCDCKQWNENNHCSHATALFLHYCLTEDGQLSDRNALPNIIGSELGVHPSKYGTIINSPRELSGAPPTCSYSSLQYKLLNNKSINFPVAKQECPAIIVNIITDSDSPNEALSFKVKTGEEVSDKVSIFENLYFFDWKSGDAFQLQKDFRDAVQVFRLNKHSLDIDDIIQLFYPVSTNNELDISLEVNGNPIEKTIEDNMHIHLSLTPSKERKLIDINFKFTNNNEKVLLPPKALRALVFENGILDIFKKKKNAYEFFEILIRDIENNSSDFRKNIPPSQRKSQLLQMTNQLFEEESIYCYDFEESCVLKYDTKMIRTIISEFVKNFSELIYRFSSYNPLKKEITYQLSSSNLFKGLNTVHLALKPYGGSIYYDRNEIRPWTSRIRFERKGTSTQWFNLELDMSKEDMELLKNADLDNGIALTSAGLVLLDQDQKNLVRFMKKYTDFEGQEHEDNQTSENKKFILPLQRARIFELFELRKLGIDGALTEEEIALCERLANLESVPDYDVPKELKGELRDYQKTGYNWLKFLYENRLGACLADDMGLGKTFQTISFIQSVYKDINKILIVCPVTILLNWEQEFKKFSDIDVCIYHGGSRNLDTTKKITLTSYGVLRREYNGVFEDQEFDILVLDEVQHLKNIRSQGAYAARKIKSNFRICLTGTPVENDLAEFFNIIDLSIPGIWGDIEFVRTTSNKKSRLLARKTASPFILRRTKAQVLNDLPPKVENNVYLNFPEKENELYSQVLNTVKSRILSSTSKRKYGEILKGLLELRQRCLWQQKTTGKYIGNVDSIKIDFLLETLEQIIEEGHQAIVFSQFTTYLDIIQNILREKHWKLSRIDGSQSVKKRQQQVEIFQNGDSQVFLISLKAGGVGLNLTAASYVFVMDPWWNPAVETQAIDRAHRIGQKNKLTVYRPIIKGTVEEKVLELQAMKKELFYDLLPENDDQYFTGKLSMKDFESLLT